MTTRAKARKRADAAIDRMARKVAVAAATHLYGSKVDDYTVNELTDFKEGTWIN